MSLRLLTLVWEKAPYKDGALLLLLALADFSNDEGISWPAVETVAHKARMGERHARRLLRQFEDDGVLVTEERGTQHRPNCYRISLTKLSEFPDRTKSPPCDSEGTRESADLTPTSADRTPGPPEPSLTAKEPPSVPVATSELTLEAGRFVEWFVELLARTNAPTPRLTPTIRAGWAAVYEKLRRIDGKEKAEIARVCEWARGDPFWSGNFYAPTKLRERKDGISRYDLFLQRLKSPNATSTTVRPNGRYFEQAGSYAGITDK